MLLKTSSKEIFRSKGMPSAQSLHCFVHLGQDIREVLPYLNTAIDGSTYRKELPSVTFKVHGKLITVHPNKIAINALKDEKEVDKINSWLQREINNSWNKRDEIEPSFENAPEPVLLEILKLLPKSNCKELSLRVWFLLHG